MRKHPFPLAAVVVLLVACSSQAAPKPRSAQGDQSQSKKVWTNDDMDQLRARGLISIVGQEPAATAAQTPAKPEEEAFPVYESRFNDPQWYADQAADLQAQLDMRMAALQQQQEALVLAKGRITDPGISLEKPDAGLTPEAGLANLEAQVQEVQSQMDELGELARQHGIEPGVLRG